MLCTCLKITLNSSYLNLCINYFAYYKFAPWSLIVLLKSIYLKYFVIITNIYFSNKLYLILSYSQWPIQGYPQRMRLQRRLYRIFFFCFLTFRVPCRSKLAYLCVLNHLVNHQNTQLNAKTKNQAFNLHIF